MAKQVTINIYTLMSIKLSPSIFNGRCDDLAKESEALLYRII